MPKKKSAVAVIDKSPFGKYTVAQILKSEIDAYVIQVGKELFVDDGKLVFTKNAADLYHGKIRENLLDVLDGGDDEERAEALYALCQLRIWPLRIN